MSVTDGDREAARVWVEHRPNLSPEDARCAYTEGHAAGRALERTRIQALAGELGEGLYQNGKAMEESGDTEDGEYRIRQWVGMEFNGLAEILRGEADGERLDALVAKVRALLSTPASTRDDGGPE